MSTHCITLRIEVAVKVEVKVADATATATKTETTETETEPTKPRLPTYRDRSKDRSEDDELSMQAAKEATKWLPELAKFKKDAYAVDRGYLNTAKSLITMTATETPTETPAPTKVIMTVGQAIELCLLAWSLAAMYHPEHREAAGRQPILLRSLMARWMKMDMNGDDLDFLRELMGGEGTAFLGEVLKAVAQC